MKTGEWNSSLQKQVVNNKLYPCSKCRKAVICLPLVILLYRLFIFESSYTFWSISIFVYRFIILSNFFYYFAQLSITLWHFLGYNAQSIGPKVPCICRICHYIRQIQGFYLSMTKPKFVWVPPHCGIYRKSDKAVNNFTDTHQVAN